MNASDFLTGCLYALPILVFIAALTALGVWLCGVFGAERGQR